MELVKKESEDIVDLPIPMQGIVDLYVSEHLPGFVTEDWHIIAIDNVTTLTLKVRRIQ